MPANPVLVGDVGGTTTRIAIDDGAVLRGLREWPTADVPSLKQALCRYRRQVSQPWRAACFAIAGPVDGDRVSLTNADWSGQLADFDVPARFANDLEAAAWSLYRFRADDVQWLRGERPARGLPAAILGLGTGLGEAYRIGDHVVAGEGGHRAFAPDDDQQRSLAAWLRDVEGRATTWEHVLCGDGLGRMAAFLSDDKDTARAPALARRVTSGEHPCADLVQALYTRCCAAEARAQALQVLATGGVWLVGGMPARIASAFWMDGFRDRFVGDGAHKSILETIPVSRITHPHPNLVGAGVLARRLLTDSAAATATA